MRPKARRAILVGLVVAFVAGACTMSGSSDDHAVGAAHPPRTIRIGMISTPDSPDSLSGGCFFRVCGRTFDPQSTSFISVFELDRCCFMRTVMSYDLSSPGGSMRLEPDLAARPPDVAADGLTWTFHLRRGLHYAPPMANISITAADVIRSIERAFSPAGKVVPWSDGGTIGGYYVDTYLGEEIVGGHEFTEGRASHIAGLQAPDPYTLEVRLTRPTGDLGYRLAVPGLGPIPANPARPDDALGVATGHNFDYGDVIVSSGPYMFEGSAAVDFGPQPLEQVPAAGNGPAVMHLVRNPSWSREDDPLRPAWPDRIEVYRVPDGEAAERLVADGALDLVLDWRVPASTIDAWRADATLRDRMHLAPADGIRLINIDIAARPFDDLHVRRAMNMVVDRERLAAIGRANDEPAEPALHIGVDSLEDNLLLDYDPFGVGASGNVRVARREMAHSAYDSDGDGRCDSDVCRDIPLLVAQGDRLALTLGRAIAGELSRIGVGVVVRPRAEVFDPSVSGPLKLTGWFKDFPDAATFFPVLFGGENRIGGAPLSESRLGATSSTLRKLGYEVTHVPNVDPQLDRCARLLFQAQVQCWANLDTYLSERVVPWVPLSQVQTGWAVSQRVDRLVIDRSTPIPVPALDALSVSDAAVPPAPAPKPPADVADIPDGLYRTTLGTGDKTSTLTIQLRDGWFVLHETSDDRIVWDPITIGSYRGSGDVAEFDIQAPFPDGVLARLVWHATGDGVRFEVERCIGVARKDAGACDYARDVWGPEDWERIAAP